MRKFVIPRLRVITIDYDILTTSAGVNDASSVGRSYRSEDESYKSGMMSFPFDDEVDW